MKAVGRAIKIFILVLIFLVIAAFAFRFWLQSYYPEGMRRMIPTDALRDAYLAGTLEAKTQEIRIGYEDPDEGLFFADHMVVVPSTGSLQVTVRYNKSTLLALSERYGDGFDAEAEAPFVYRIFCSTGTAEDGETIVGETYLPLDSRKDSFAMYYYERLAFEGVELDGVYWIRLEIYRLGEEKPEGSIVIYENHEKYNKFEEYKVTSEELS